MVVRVLVYLAAIVVANLLVTTWGRPGLLLSSAFLIPFDFVMRSYFHERWKRNYRLVINLGALVSAGALLTYLLNQDARNIALGSVCGFVVANIVSGAFYQLVVNRAVWFKVNGSDVVAIIVDSMVFQVVAFGDVSLDITGGQMLIKLLGGVMWYFILFRVFNILGK